MAKVLGSAKIRAVRKKSPLRGGGGVSNSVARSAGESITKRSIG